MDTPRSNSRHAEEMRLRLKAFAVRIIRLVETLPRSLSGQTLGRQPLRSATSEAANYRAACRARSRAGFVAKMSIVVEQADETVFWLELLAEAGLIERQRIQDLLDEARQLVKLTSKARHTAQENRTRS